MRMMRYDDNIQMLVARVASVAAPNSELEPPLKKARMSLQLQVEESDADMVDDCNQQLVPSTPSQLLESTSSKPNLYMDVMHSILQFLQFDELAIASQLSSNWKVAVRTLKPQRNGSVALGKLAKKSMISWPTPKYRRSAVLPHITHVNIGFWENLDPSTQCGLLRPFTRLQAIVGMQISHCLHLSPFKLPSTLTSLSVNVSVWALQKLINACSQLKSLTTLHILDVTDYDEYLNAQEAAEETEKETELAEEAIEEVPEINFKPLSRLMLEDLAFQVQYYESSSDTALVIDLMYVVSDMSSLLRLHMGDITTEEINGLIRKPHRMNSLLDFHCRNDYLEPDYLRILGCHFPTLIDLPGISKVRNLDDCSLLLKLPGLRTLRLEFRHTLSWQIPPIDQLIEHIRQLQLLEILEIAHPLITSEHLAELFKHLPLLRSLKLNCCLSLTELTFLNASPLSKTLKAFHLQSCANIPSIELFQLKALSKLEELHILSSFNEPLCKFAQFYFEPHSPLCVIPTLKEFLYDHNHQLIL